MTAFTHRYCRYLPSLYEPQEYCVFAIAVASDRELALVGVNLSEYNLTDQSALGKIVTEQTFDIMWKRIVSVTTSHKPRSGHEALEHLEDRWGTNICVSEIGSSESDRSIKEEAFDLFQKVEVVLRQQLHSHEPGTWQEGPRTIERTTELAGAC